MALDVSGLITESIVWLNTKTLDVPTAIALGGWLAGKVNTIQGLSGAEKQALVCRVVEEVVHRQMPEGDAKDGLLAALKIALPAALTLAVDAARGRLSLKKVNASCFVGWMLCFARSAVSVAEAAHVKVPDAVKAAEAAAESVAAAAGIEVVSVAPEIAPDLPNAVPEVPPAEPPREAVLEPVAEVPPAVEDFPAPDAPVVDPAVAEAAPLEPVSEASSETPSEAEPEVQSEESAPVPANPESETPVNPEPVKAVTRARRSKKASAS
jgi:hypothetical protein